MSTLTPGPEPREGALLDYHTAEGLHEGPPTHIPLGDSPEKRRSEWILVGLGLTALVAILSVVMGAYAVLNGGGTRSAVRTVVKPAAAQPAAAADKAPT